MARTQLALARQPQMQRRQQGLRLHLRRSWLVTLQERRQSIMANLSMRRLRLRVTLARALVARPLMVIESRLIQKRTQLARRLLTMC
jgi:hypothetical protein